MESTLVKAVEVVLSYGVLLALFWAFYDGTRFTNEQYKATGRMGRTGWLIALGFAIVLDFSVAHFRFSDPLGGRSLTWVATVVLLVIYLYDMRPKLVQQRLAGA